MPTEMELTLEQTQQGVSHEVSVNPHEFEGYLKMVVKVPDSSWLTRFIATCSYSTDKYKDIMKAQVTVMVDLGETLDSCKDSENLPLVPKDHVFLQVILP
ncbi:hypothetical protein Tco_1194460 [Tanacetum coccineum]